MIYNTLQEVLKTNQDKQIISEPLPELKFHFQSTLEMTAYDPEIDIEVLYII